MNRRKKGGNNSLKPPAQAKPSPSSVATSPPAPAPAAPMPSRVSPPPKATTPPQNVPSSSKPAQPAVKVGPQPPRLSASPPKPPVPSMPPAKTAIPPPRPGPPQRPVLTRSDRVRAVWTEFFQVWVTSKHDEIAKQLEHLLHAVENNPRVRGKALDDSKDKIINTKRRDFAMAARAEWERRLAREGLEAEDWTDIKPEEMAAVEQVLSCDEGDDQSNASTTPMHDQGVPTLSMKMAAEASHPMAPHPPAATQPSPPMSAQKIPQVPPPAAAQKGKQSHAQPAWTAWGPGPRHVSVSEVPEEPPQRTASAWGKRQNAPIIEEIRVSPKAATAPPPPQTSQPAFHPAQPVPPAEPVTTTLVPVHGLLVYPVPISWKMAPLDSTIASDLHFVHLVDNAYVNSIKEFHNKAADVDAALARELRKPMPPSEREWTVRAHMMTMEQIARTIVENRDTMIENERRKRGFSGDGHGGVPPAPPSAPKAAVTSQPPGAFPDDGIHVSPVVHDPEVEIEREPEPDVDEVIEIPLKGKTAKKKGKKAAAANGRSTPIPAISSTMKSTTPAAKPVVVEKPTPTVEKPVPIVEKKPPVASAWGWGAKAAVPMRSASPAPRVASPAPIRTKVAPTPAPVPTPAPTGRGTPIPPGMTPWEAMQAKAAGTFRPAEPQPKPPSPPNGMWAPPVARVTSNKNPFAPTRPSRLAQVSEPESPEPPSPPPIPVEPTGKDYVAWFAGSSSEDEDAGLSEDEDGDDEDSSGSDPQHDTGPAGLGSILGALAGASPWALFSSDGGAQSHSHQKERGHRAAHPDRGRGAATPAPAMAAAGRFGGDMGIGMGASPAMGAGWAQWAADTGSGTSGFRHGHGTGSGGHVRGPAGHQWPMQEDDNLEDMLEVASKTLGRAAGGQARGGANIEEAMAMYVTAQKARETLVTPVGGRSANPWGRR